MSYIQYPVMDRKMKNRKEKRRKKIDKCLLASGSNCQSFKQISMTSAALGLLFVGGLSPVAENGGYSTVSSHLAAVKSSCCEQRPQVMQVLGVVLGLHSCGSWVLEHRLRSCGFARLALGYGILTRNQT